jgi:hypothetical protein
MQSVFDSPDFGRIQLMDHQNRKMTLAVGSTGEGRIILNASGNIIARLQSTTTDNDTLLDRGQLELFDPIGVKVNAHIDVNIGGTITTFGPDLQRNFLLQGATANQNYGELTLFDDVNEARAGFTINANQYELHADMKTFKSAWPEKADSEIWYVAMEGPEAAAYVRGTGQLQNGQAFISFPDHFEKLINATTLTVRLTPLSAESQGLAVIEKSTTGIAVKELQGGHGNYTFDWEVTGVRSGYENFEPVRDKK